MRAAALAAALATVLLAGPARAFCVTSACGDQVAGTLCVPEGEGDCGQPLRWRSRCT